jgi:predicted XRE-type DNA-binding protein
MNKNLATTQNDPKLYELVAIKKLLVFALLSNGAKQEKVASALGVSQSTISKMFPKGTFDD